MDTAENIINIIAKKLHGEANPEELLEIQRWIEVDHRNAEEYEKLVKIWEEIDGILFSAPSFNAEVAWQKLDSDIANKRAMQSAIKPAFSIASIFSKRMAVAAAVIVVFFIGFLLVKNRTNWQTVTAEKANQPVSLPDNSVVILRKGSTIEYPAVFDKAERRVMLTGEAFFEVHRNEQQPFIITTLHSTVKVLGTSFLVRSKTAMDEVVVVSGKVSVTARKKTGNQLMLTTGQKAVLQDDQFSQSEVKDLNYIAWKNGLLDFKDASLATVLEDIGHYYEIPIGVSDEHNAAIEKIRITVHFENQSLDEVLEEIKLITGLQIKKENGKTFFYQK